MKIKQNIAMFYGAKPNVFEFAKELRVNLTEAEKILWERIKNKQLGTKFRRQHPIDRFIADFYCHQAKLVIELDGPIHMNQKEYDINRDAEIEKFDIKIVRVKNQEIFDDIEGVINKIKTELNHKRRHP